MACTDRHFSARADPKVLSVIAFDIKDYITQWGFCQEISVNFLNNYEGGKMTPEEFPRGNPPARGKDGDYSLFL